MKVSATNAYVGRIISIILKIDDKEIVPQMDIPYDDADPDGIGFVIILVSPVSL